MSKFYTPEEVAVRRKRNKVLLYTTILLGTILLSALITFLSHSM